MKVYLDQSNTANCHTIHVSPHTKTQEQVQIQVSHLAELITITIMFGMATTTVTPS